MVRPRDDHDDGAETPSSLNAELFRSEGELQLDAYHFARAAGAVLAACDDTATLQLEIFDDEGVLVVGTDKVNLLRAWVPMPADEGWRVTAEIAGPGPKLDETPSRIVSASLTALGQRMLAELGKPKRAKERARELITLQWGTRIEGDQPTLGGDTQARAVRFVSDENISIAADPQAPFDWRPVARVIDDADAAVIGWGIAISGARAIQYGKIANALGGERAMLISPAEVDERRYTRVAVPGFPVVMGFGADA